MVYKKTIGLVSSSGGHFAQLYLLHNLFKKYNRFWVVTKNVDTQYHLQNERKYYAFSPESRNIINLVKNTRLALKILIAEKPAILISTGAGVALPFFIIGKMLGCRLIFIEPFDLVEYPTVTGKLLYYITDLFIVQHKKQMQWYKNAHYFGSVL